MPVASVARQPRGIEAQDGTHLARAHGGDVVYKEREGATRFELIIPQD